MNLEDIRPNLKTIIQGVSLLVPVAANVVVDDGKQNTVMEDQLKADGITMLLMAPIGFDADQESRGVTWIDYSVTVWLRTNPHVLSSGVAKWDPAKVERLIINAVMQYSRNLPPVLGFKITRHAEPEQDYQDTGNDSRLIRFMTRCVFQ